MKRLRAKVTRVAPIAALFMSVQCAWIFGLDDGQARVRPDDATLTFDPPEVGVVVGESAHVKVTIDPRAHYGPVRFSVRGLPAGVTTDPSAPAPVGDDPATFDLEADPSAHAGDEADLTIDAADDQGVMPSTHLHVQVRGKPGTIDMTFGEKGVAYAPLSWSDSGVIDSAALNMAIDDDGNILAVGYTPVPSPPNNEVYLARFHPDGALDTSFGTHGALIQHVSNYHDWANVAVRDNAGRLLVGGSAGNASHRYDPLLLRYDTDGGLDPTFGEGGISRFDLGSAAQIFVVLPGREDGSLFVGATVNDESGNSKGAVLLSVDALGHVVKNFGVDPSFDSYFDVQWSDAQKRTFIVTGARQGCPAGRFTVDGTKDGTFGPNGDGVCGPATGSVDGKQIAVQPDGKIVVVLDREGSGGGVVRIDSRGAVDPSFAASSVDHVAHVPPLEAAIIMRGIALEPDGKVVVAGGRTDPANPSPVLARFTAAGELDPTFAADTGEPRFVLDRVAVQVKGHKLVACGSMRTTSVGFGAFAIARYWL